MSVRWRIPTITPPCGIFLMAQKKKEVALVEPGEAAPVPAESEISFFSPVEITASLRLLRSSRKQVLQQWAKAVERLETDAGGAITAARALLQPTCPALLEQTKTLFHQKAHPP